MTPSELARDGFYYLGTGDRVKCIFCNLVLKNWEFGDIVTEEHKKFNASCPFLLNRCVGNIPLEQETMASVPKFSEYSKPEDRIETMKNVPKMFKGSENLFVEAGFFYTGIKVFISCRALV